MQVLIFENSEIKIVIITDIMINNDEDKIYLAFSYIFLISLSFSIRNKILKNYKIKCLSKTKYLLKSYESLKITYQSRSWKVAKIETIMQAIVDTEINDITRLYVVKIMMPKDNKRATYIAWIVFWIRDSCVAKNA